MVFKTWSVEELSRLTLKRTQFSLLSESHWYKKIPGRSGSQGSQFQYQQTLVNQLLLYSLWYLGSNPQPVTVANEGLWGFPTKNVTILVVTVTGWGVDLRYLLHYPSRYSCFGLKSLDARFQHHSLLWNSGFTMETTSKLGLLFWC